MASDGEHEVAMKFPGMTCGFQVSRCGMVFLEQQDIGWQVLMLSWSSTQIDAVLLCGPPCGLAYSLLLGQRLWSSSDLRCERLPDRLKDQSPLLQAAETQKWDLGQVNDKSLPIPTESVVFILQGIFVQLRAHVLTINILKSFLPAAV